MPWTRDVVTKKKFSRSWMTVASKRKMWENMRKKCWSRKMWSRAWNVDTWEKYLPLHIKIDQFFLLYLFEGSLKYNLRS